MVDQRHNNNSPPHWGEELIIVVGLVLMFVVVGMLVYMAFALLAAEGQNATRQACLDMFFGDGSDTGYVEALAAKCWKLLQ